MYDNFLLWKHCISSDLSLDCGSLRICIDSCFGSQFFDRGILFDKPFMSIATSTVLFLIQKKNKQYYTSEQHNNTHSPSYATPNERYKKYSGLSTALE